MRAALGTGPLYTLSQRNRMVKAVSADDGSMARARSVATAQDGGAEYRQSRLEGDLRELARSITGLQERIDGKFERLETRIDGIKNEVQISKLALPDGYMPRRELQERFENIAADTVRQNRETDERIKKIEDSMSRLLWLVLGALTTGCISLLVTLVAAVLKAGLRIGN